MVNLKSSLRQTLGIGRHHHGPLASSFNHGRLQRYKAVFIALLVLTGIIFWRHACIDSYSYDSTNHVHYRDSDCLSLVTFTANMFVWGILTPIVLLTSAVSGGPLLPRSSCDKVDEGYDCHKDISRLWGPYTPFYAVESDIKEKIDSKCTVTFASVISRHGARYPTKGLGARIAATINKIHASAKEYKHDFKFLKNYKYTYPADQLTAFGQQEMYNSGIKFAKRYQKLSLTNDPFIRASGQERVVESGIKFTKGFIDEKMRKGGKPALPFPNPLIIYEGDMFNNTLDHSACYEFEEGRYADMGADAQAKYAAVFTAGIIRRIKGDIPGVDLNANDIVNLMHLCPFGTVAEEKGTPLSPFCKIFKDDEFKQYDYYQTLQKFYQFGPGNPLGPAQGIGYVNELIARLTNTAVKDHTTTNHTLTGNPQTFPLGRKLYADFSHDNTMVSIYAAMNLFNGIEHLSNVTRTKNDFAVAKLVPFAARMYVEKLQCEKEPEELVRVLINDKVMPLKGCKEIRDGACRLDDWIGTLGWARSGGNWSECGASKAQREAQRKEDEQFKEELPEVPGEGKGDFEPEIKPILPVVPDEGKKNEVPEREGKVPDEGVPEVPHRFGERV